MNDDRNAWFTLKDIKKVDDDSRLFCVAVDSPTHQFLIGKTGVPTHNTDEQKETNNLKGEASALIGSILRLGRAAGVVMVGATQRPDASILPGEQKNNYGVRVVCGTANPIASSMVLDDSEGTRVKNPPRGRIYVKIYSHGNHAQGFFQPQDWIDKWLDEKGLNQDGTPKGSSPAPSQVMDVDHSALEGTLDDIDGIDNDAIIDQMREQDLNTTPVDVVEDENGTAWVSADSVYSDEEPETVTFDEDEALADWQESDHSINFEAMWSPDLEKIINENDKGM